MCVTLIFCLMQRMNIGLRAFFVIAESLQRKVNLPLSWINCPARERKTCRMWWHFNSTLPQGGEAPPMPTTGGIILPSGSTVKAKKVTLLNLSESQASSIGLANYYHRWVAAQGFTPESGELHRGGCSTCGRLLRLVQAQPFELPFHCESPLPSRFLSMYF